MKPAKIFSASISLMMALALNSCSTAKEDAFVDTNKRLRRVLSETLNIPESRMARTDTLANVGYMPGENDQKVITAIEREFKIVNVKKIIFPNMRLYTLVDSIADYRKKQAESTFGPLRPSTATPPDVTPGGSGSEAGGAPPMPPETTNIDPAINEPPAPSLTTAAP